MSSPVPAVVDSILDATILFSYDKSGFARHARNFVPGDLDVDLSVGQAEVADDASAAVAEDAFAVGVVYVDHSAVLRALLGHLVQGGHVTVHAEHAVGYYEHTPILWAVLLCFVKDLG